MKTILVTGAAGFIGSHTVEQLLATTDCKVVAIDDLSTGRLSNLRQALNHSRCQFTRADIGTPGMMEDLCRLHQPDSIIHLAGLVSVSRAEIEPDLNFSLNLRNTHLVAESARKTGVGRIVFASSAACYGESTELPLSEDQIATPISMYGSAKLASETLLAGYSSSYGIETVSLRYFNVYGERQDSNSPYSGVITLFAEAFARNGEAALFGDGSQTRDFISVKDVARANVISATATRIDSGVRNICTGNGRSLLEVLAAFKELYGAAVPLRYKSARVGDIHDSCGNPERACNDLGFRASIPLKEGLRSLVICNRKALHSA